MICYHCQSTLCSISTDSWSCLNKDCLTNYKNDHGSTYIEKEYLNNNIIYYSFLKKYKDKIYRVWSNGRYNVSGISSFKHHKEILEEYTDEIGIMSIDKFFELDEKDDFKIKFDNFFNKMIKLTVFL